MGVITLEEYLKRQKKKESNGVISLEEFAERQGVDLAPIRSSITTTSKDKEDEKKRTWFQKGAFEDGYQLGDITKTLLGSRQDIQENLTTGVIGMGEKFVDGLMQASPYVYQGQMAQAYGGFQTPEMIEQTQKTVEQMKKESKEFVEKDLYNEEKVAKTIIKGTVSGQINNAIGVSSEKDSVLGEKSDSLVQSVGQMGATTGLQALGVPWWLTTGMTSFGGEVENAYKQGATYSEAGMSGLITAGAEVGTELLGGGISFGSKTLDDVLIDPLLRKVGNKAVRTGLKVGTEAVGEGLEEIASGSISALGQQATYQEDKKFSELFSKEDAIESFIGGAVMGGGSSGGKAIQSTMSGTDYVTGQTKSEQKLTEALVNEKVTEATKQKALETEVEKAIAEREKAQGGQLTEKNKEALKNSVMQKIESGEIDTSSTTLDEDVLKDIRKEVEENLEKGEYELSKIENILASEKTAQIEQLEKTLESTKDEKQKTEIQKQINELKTAKLTELKGMLRENRYLVKSSYEAKMSNESYRYTEDTSEGEYAKAVRESAKTHLSNNTYSRNYVDAMAKLSEDTKRNYRFVNEKELAEQGDIVEDLDVGGLVKVDENGVETVLINVDSKQAPYRVLVHETKHVLESSDLNEAYNKMLFDYAKQTGDYDTFREQIKKLYETTDEAKITKEMSAELSAYYFSNDTKFLETITKEKTIVQKIKEVIDDFVLRFKGTAQEKQYRELQKTFEQMLKNAKNTESKKAEDVEFSLANKNIAKDTKIPIVENPNYRAVPQNDHKALEGLRSEVKKIARGTYENKATGYKASINADTIGKIISPTSKYDPWKGNYIDNLNASIYLPTLFENAVYVDTKGNQKPKNANKQINGFHHFVAPIRMNGNDYRVRITAREKANSDTLYIVDAEILNTNNKGNALPNKTNGNISALPSEMSIAELVNGVKIYDYNTQQDDVYTDADIKYSLSDVDSVGNKLSPAVKKRLENTKAVDEDGNPKVLYHGTPSGEFTIFDKSKGSVEGDFGSGFYFTDNESDVEVNYEGGGPDFENKVSRRAEQIEAEEDIEYEEAEQRAREELFKGSNKFEVYLNIENPAIVGETTLLSQDDYLENYDPDDYDDYDDYIADVEQLVADDIENLVWEVEKNVDVYSTDGLADVLFEAYYEGGIGIEDLKARINDLYLEDSDGNMVGNEVTRQIIESLGYDGIIDSTVSSKFKNMGLDEGTTHYIVFKPNQIKSITNESPTDNPDINMSLSNGIAPTQKMLQDLRVGGRDIAPIRKDIAKKDYSDMEGFPIRDDYAPLTEEQANERDAQQSDRLFSLTENDMPDEIEAPIREDLVPNDPFDERDMKDVGKRNVKAYMYENPEVKPFFQEEAKVMLRELSESIKGERVVNADVLYHSGGEAGIYGVTRSTSDEIAYLLDNYNYSYADIEKGLKAIIEDHGAENNAISKRIEFMLNDRLGQGYTDFTTGMDIPANQDYLNMLVEKQVTEYSDEAKQKYLESLAETYAEPMSKDIAPIRDDIAPIRQYEAIEPAPQNLDAQEQEWANNKIVRAKDPNRVQASNTDVKQRRWVETSTESEVVNREILPEDLDLSKIVYEPIPNKVTLSKANSKLDILGYDEALTTFKSKLANNKVELEDIALGERLLQEAMKKGDNETAGELIQDIAILGTELGQKVQALSIIQRLTPEGQLKMLYKTVRRGKVKGDKAFEGVELTQEMIDHILKTYKADGTFDQNDLNKAVEDVKKDLAKSMKVSGIDKVNAYRYLSMLGNPKTHIRNIVSNVAMKGTLSVKNAVARTIEDIAPIKNRTKTWERATDEVKAFADKTTIEMKSVISEDTKYSEEASIKSQRDMFKNQILNKLYNFNNDLMAKEDWWFSKTAYKTALSEFLTANGIKTTEDIAKNQKTVEKAKQYALEQSQIATFRQYSWLANKIREIESKNIGTEIAVGSILPFKKTPINIAKAGLSYSPLGFTKTLTYDIAQVKKGNMEASTLVDHLAQNTTGTALTLVGYMLAMSGMLNGGGEDDKEGSYDYQLGEQSYSLTIGDNTYSLSWLSPVAMPLFVGANAYEQLNEGKEWNGDVVIETLAQTLDPLSEMSFLSSLDSVLSSYDSGVEKFAGIGEAMLQNYLTQFIPTASSQLASTLDDTKRTTKVAGDSEFKRVEETINKLIYKIPFLRETLEPSTDIWGNEVKQSETLIGRALENFIAPYSRKEKIATEIDAEIKDLYAQTGDNGIIPNVPYNYVNYNGEKYKMSAEEYTDYKKTYGQTAYDLLDELFRTTTYQNATSKEKADMINDVYDYATDEAKREFLKKEGVDYTNAKKDGADVYKENGIKGAVDNDMMLEEFDLYIKNPSQYIVSKVVGDYEAYKTYTSELSDITADKDASGKTINGSRKEKVINYLNTLDIDYGAKLLLYKSEYNADDTYNYEIIDYLNNREDISYQEMKTILEGLGFTVDEDGTIYWD